MTPGQRWNALMDTLPPGHPWGLYFKALRLLPGYQHLNGPKAHQHMDHLLARIRTVVANTDPSALHAPPLRPIHDPYREPFRATHVGRRGGSFVQVMHRTKAFVEFRTQHDRSGCSPNEFDQLFRPLNGQMPLL
jgi:hypothetical protein